MELPLSFSKILLIDLSGIGDVVLSMPVVRVLSRHFPHAAIDMLVATPAQPLLVHHPLLRRAIAYDRNYFRGHPLASHKVLRALRDAKYDLVINLQPTPRCNLISILSGVQHRIGFISKRITARCFLTHALPWREEVHDVDINLSLLAPLGITDLTHRGLEVFPGPDDIARVEEMWQQANIPDDVPVIGIHNGSNLPLKQWTEAGHIALIEHLLDRGFYPVMFGGPGDVDTARRITNNISRPIPMFTGRLSLLELAAMLRKCTVLVSCDSGPMHIAASQGVPCVALFGPTTAHHWGPYGNQHLVIQSSFACDEFPCGMRRCPHRERCMAYITPEQVIEAVEQQVHRCRQEVIA
ncbi:MAG: glycosyltransferase family 9 protein [Armatimonadota bacterium]